MQNLVKPENSKKENSVANLENRTDLEKLLHDEMAECHIYTTVSPT